MSGKPNWFKEWEGNDFKHLVKDVKENKRLVYVALLMMFLILTQTEGGEDVLRLLMSLIAGI